MIYDLEDDKVNIEKKGSMSFEILFVINLRIKYIWNENGKGECT